MNHEERFWLLLKSQNLCHFREEMKQIIHGFQSIIDKFPLDYLPDHSLVKILLTISGAVHLHHLSGDCRRLLSNAEKVIEVDILEDPTYKVPVDK